MDKAEIEKLLEEAATPIDFDGLIASGVLEKKGAWYLVHKWKELPEHAQRKVSTIEQTTSTKDGKTTNIVRVKFRAPMKKK